MSCYDSFFDKDSKYISSFSVTDCSKDITVKKIPAILATSCQIYLKT